MEGLRADLESLIVHEQETLELGKLVLRDPSVPGEMKKLVRGEMRNLTIGSDLLVSLFPKGRDNGENN